MDWFLYLICSLIILVAGITAGCVWTTRSYEKHSHILVRYFGLTSKSKDLVNGYIAAREVNDERTTFKERH